MNEYTQSIENATPEQLSGLLAIGIEQIPPRIPAVDLISLSDESIDAFYQNAELYTGKPTKRFQAQHETVMKHFSEAPLTSPKDIKEYIVRRGFFVPTLQDYDHSEDPQTLADKARQETESHMKFILGLRISP